MGDCALSAAMALALSQPLGSRAARRVTASLSSALSSTFDNCENHNATRQGERAIRPTSERRGLAHRSLCSIQLGSDNATMPDPYCHILATRPGFLAS